MSFDRTRCRQVGTALDEALKPLGERLGLTIRLGSASFTSGNIRFQLNVFEDAITGSPEAEDFRICCSHYGLQAEDLNKTFTWGGKQYVLVGCKPRATRFPLLGRGTDGKMYKFPVDIADAIRPGARRAGNFRSQSREAEIG
jgi:hypothetical protein